MATKKKKKSLPRALSIPKSKVASRKPKSKPGVGLNTAKKAARAKAANANKPKPKGLQKAKHATQIEEKKMTNTKANFEKMTFDTTAFGKDQMDAFMRSGNLWMKGTEDIVKAYVELAQESVQKSSEAAKALLACKTLNELTETQNKLAQESLEDFMSGATKLSEMSVKLATDSFAPLTAQATKATRKAADSMAA